MLSARQTLKRSQRIRRRREFLGIYDQGLRLRGRYMTVFVRRQTGSPTRFGVAASRRLGNAVTRNRAKRRARELFRQALLPAGLDVVLAPRRELVAAPFARLRGEFEKLLARPVVRS